MVLPILEFIESFEGSVDHLTQEVKETLKTLSDLNKIFLVGDIATGKTTVIRYLIAYEVLKLLIDDDYYNSITKHLTKNKALYIVVNDHTKFALWEMFKKIIPSHIKIERTRDGFNLFDRVYITDRMGEVLLGKAIWGLEINTERKGNIDTEAVISRMRSRFGDRFKLWESRNTHNFDSVVMLKGTKDEI